MKNSFQPKVFVIDVDGVLTDGQFHYSEEGKVMKVFGPNDNDALQLVQRYLKVHMVSADKRGFKITQKRIDDMKLPLTLVPSEDRIEWIGKNFGLKNTIYMGDGFYDARIFEKVAYGIAPANAFFHTKARADFVTPSRGGDGAAAEACLHILEQFFEPFDPRQSK